MSERANGGDPRDLLAVIEALEVKNSTLTEKNVALIEQVQALSDKIAGLEKRLDRNSSNSSLPPSSDRFSTKPKPESPNRTARPGDGSQARQATR